MKHIDTQKAAIKAWLQTGKALTSMEAIRLCGCTKSSSRIGEMERDGMIRGLQRKRIKVKNRYGHTVSVMQYKLK